MGILKQDNLRAGRVLIECGLVRGGQPGNAISHGIIPPNIRVSNRKCISDTTCTKSESMVWGSTKDNGMTIVVNYNDDWGGGVTGTSYSVDGGAHFKEILPPPFTHGHGTNFGDPIVVFNSKLNMFFAGDLVSGGCGSQGVGLWTSTDGKVWKVGACAHNGGGDDRPSMWVDNEPTSGTYGRMYISWNDFTNNGALSVTFSDDGKNWHAPVILNSGYITDVQVTGSPVGAKRFEGKNSTAFVAAMDAGGGGCNTRQNIMYKSLDGGVTWTSATLGPRFNPICDGLCDNPYFAKVNPIIRYLGSGQPGVGPNGVVHYAYAGLGESGNDPGDIYYVRSKDNGKTWSAPKKLNTDKDAAFKSQWMPSLSADGNGKVTVSWYDRRKSTSACDVPTDPGCSYERVARQSGDNGATFLPEFAVSTVHPQPTQEDPTIQACYAGDYDYDTALNGNAYITWTDGARAVEGIHVQDVDFAQVPEP